MYKIGFRAHDWGMYPSASELAKAISSVSRPTFVHLAPRRAILQAPDPRAYTTDYATQIRKEMEEWGVGIAILGCHINPIHPDKEEREADLERFCHALEIAPFFGCRIVASESGSAKADCSYTPETYESRHFDELIESTARIVGSAERSGSLACYEGGQHTLNTPSRIERILMTFPNPHFGLLFDPVNLVPPTGIPEKDGSVRFHPSEDAQLRFIADHLDRYANRIVAMHVKNYRMQENGLKTAGMAADKGVLDWKLVFRMLESYGVKAVMTLENCSPGEAPSTLAYLSACQQ